ncbi:MAG TPA: hypothetical protein VK738_15865 [Terriglobales bacterium]|jgi:tetratricopeptide (TPR) repeat protein|nr:hypothetical protein [Terriglobales bacterium]
MDDSRAGRATQAFREGVTLWKVHKDRHGAVEKLSLCLSLVPGVPEALYNRALILAELGEDDRAVQDLRALEASGSPLAQQLATLFDVHAQATVSIGVKKLRDGAVAEAVELFTRASVFAPDNPVPYNNRGLALRAAGDDVAALKDLDTAVQLGWQGEHYLFDTAGPADE